MRKIYTGTRTNDGTQVCVTVGSQTLLLPHIPFHSPTGFEWGYGGAGPADLALAILVDHLEEKPPRWGWKDAGFNDWTATSAAWQHHQAFKQRFVAQFAEERWELTSVQIAQWLRNDGL